MPKAHSPFLSIAKAYRYCPNFCSFSRHLLAQIRCESIYLPLDDHKHNRFVQFRFSDELEDDQYNQYGYRNGHQEYPNSL